MVTFWTLFLIAPLGLVRLRRRNSLLHNNLNWWAHLDSIRSREATEDSKRPKGAQLTRDQRIMSPLADFAVAGVLRESLVIGVR
jgi:hypothetical protein